VHVWIRRGNDSGGWLCNPMPDLMRAAWDNQLSSRYTPARNRQGLYTLEIAKLFLRNGLLGGRHLCCLQNESEGLGAPMKIFDNPLPIAGLVI
jgi:hypothetical protein